MKQKEKTCKVCKNKFMPFQTTQKVCGVKCAISLSRIEGEKKQRRKHIHQKVEFQKNDIERQKKAAQREFNAFIRYRDRNEPCISCGKDANANVKWAAGHFFTRGARPDLRFNEDNCHKQCDFDCNCSLSGNLLKYRPRLIEKIGIERYKALEEVKTVRYRAEDYRAIAKLYRQKLKQLTDGP